MAWIANYLSYGDMACHFDAFVPGLQGLGPAAIQDLANTAKVVGIADSAALLYQDRLITKNPHAKWVAVERDPAEVRESFKKLNVPVDDRLTLVNHKLGELKLKTDVKVFSFNELDNGGIQKLALYVNPNWGCPGWRHDMLIGLNVQSKATVSDLEKIPSVNPLSEAAEPMTPTKTQENFFAMLQEICGSDGNAYRWLCQAIQCATCIDHVMDNDLIDYALFDETMKSILLEWGVNEFFLKNSRYLVPVMSAALSAWQHSTGEMKRVKHYDIYTELPCAIAFMRGGQALVDKFSPRLRAIVEQLMLEDEIRDDT